ncbi:MAG: TlpA family protein disulfide reductase [Nitrospirae bacterium]|nr:TlpA family protein disulfide reductase [Fimbriimonadaceae bacterium]
MAFSLTLIAAAAIAMPLQQAKTPPLPRPMPLLNLRDGSGKMWNRPAFTDKVVLIEFWATWCASCKKMRPTLNELRKTYADRGFETLFVSIDQDKKALDRYLAGKPFDGPVVHATDGRWSEWDVTSVPAMFLVRDGQIVAQWTGETPKAKLDEAILKALAPR